MRGTGVAAVVSFVGGVFILLGGAVMAILGALISLLGFSSGFFYVGITIGLLVLAFSILLWAVPPLHLAWGIALLVLAVLSLPFAFLGGFIIGFILTFLGGLFGIFSRPRGARWG